MLIAGIVFLPFAEAVLFYALGRKSGGVRGFAAFVPTILELVLSVCLLLNLPSFEIPGVLAGSVSFTTDGFRAVYSIVTSLMWLGTTLFSKEYFAHEDRGLNSYTFFILMTLGATQGVMLSADLMTTFFFFEILSFTSFPWVIREESREAIDAAMTYLFIAVIGGLLVFMGLLLLRQSAGTLRFDALSAAVSSAKDQNAILAAGILILLGFGAKAGMFPLHVWLPKAHPVAPAPASALLSGILTKVGLYGVLMTTIEAFAANLSYGALVLILGTVTMVLGAVLALFSVNLKRTLACSSMSQIGFILTGIGMSVFLNAAGQPGEAEMALSGAMLHMVNHSLWKLALFLAAGAVAMNLHALNLNDIRGFGRKQTLLKISFALASLGISGVPLFNGYLSKTLLHEGIASGILLYPGAGAAFRLLEILFLISGGLTFAYMLKLYLCIFVEKNRTRQADFDARPACMTPLSSAVVLGSSLLALLLGIPRISLPLAAFLSGNEEVLSLQPFSLSALAGIAVSLAIGAVVYVLFVRRALMKDGFYLDRWPKKLDLEEGLYRPLLLKGLPTVFGSIASVFAENKILIPCAKALLFVLSVIGRAMSTGTDSLIVLLRRSVLRERKVQGEIPRRIGRMKEFLQETKEATEPVFSNFSFALIMTCVGILMILGILLLAAV